MLASTILLSSAVYAYEDKSKDDLEAQLKAARHKLEEAANEVAELSARLGKPLVERLLTSSGGAGHAVIGAQLDAEDSSDGAHVRDVTADGPAAAAGMRTGDVIVGVNGTNVRVEHAAAEVARLMRAVAPNSKIKIRVLRAGKPFEFEVTARDTENARDTPGIKLTPGARSEGAAPAIAGSKYGALAGMELVTLSPQLGAYFGTDRGVLVLRTPRSAAFRLQDGDVILSIDGDEPDSGAHATRILASYQPGEKVKLRLMRQHKNKSFELQAPERR